MPATARDTWSLDEADTARASFEDAQAHDAYWRWAHERENYFRREMDYEDYAPAYCVGYVGQAQYGGDFAEAEKSLISNWVRIKGDSRLELDEAMMAMRAAWDRAAGVVPAAEAQAEPQSLPWSAYAQKFASSAAALADRLFGAQPARPIAPRQ